MHKLIIYTQPTCPQCKMFKMLMDKKGIQYECCEDVDTMRSLGITKTPTLSVDGVLLIGAQIRDFINLGEIPENCNTCEVK